METLKVKSMYFIQSENFGLTPVFNLEDGREIKGKWSPTGLCFDFSFEFNLEKIKKCNHPQMGGECIEGKDICCKYCSQVKECLKGDKQICPFINNKDDLDKLCPFEKNHE
jgi:hypothetical protein